MTTTREHMTKAELVGRLGQTPELRYTADQTPLLRMSIATSERYTSSEGEIRERTDWHNAVAWGAVAEEIAARSLSKGDSIVLSGSLRINSYEKDGVKNRITEINVDSAVKNVDNLPSKNDVRLIGVVRQDPNVRCLDDGTLLTTLSVVTRTAATGKDGVAKDREDWHSVPLWGRTAEAARGIKAGDSIAINGGLRHETIPDATGQERKLSAIKCQRFQVLDIEHAQMKTPAAERAPEGPPAGLGQKVEPPTVSPPRRPKRGVDRAH